MNLSVRFRPVSLAFIGLYLCCAAFVFGQAEKRQLTLEWIFGPEGRSVTAVPATAWLDDGTLILFDTRKPAGERTFEKLDPASGAGGCWSTKRAPSQISRSP